jgi:hypothetical protein
MILSEPDGCYPLPPVKWGKNRTTKDLGLDLGDAGTPLHKAQRKSPACGRAVRVRFLYSIARVKGFRQSVCASRATTIQPARQSEAG